jgi:hypothetical protein
MSAKDKIANRSSRHNSSSISRGVIMPEKKVLYCLLLLTLLDATLQIRSSLHGHNNGEDRSLSLSLSFFFHLYLSFSLSLSLSLSLFLSLPLIPFSHDYFDANRDDSRLTITNVCFEIMTREIPQ